VVLNNPDLMKYAEGLGADGCRIESADVLAPALAWNPNKLAIIDCPLDAAENLRLTQRRAAFAVNSGFQP
jgi:thiamine pyrophosphate-dependent acetolactate synthase large subunit-like protein